MSMSVTEELDVFDALGLLLKPDGVMVKNELYFDKFSEGECLPRAENPIDSPGGKIQALFSSPLSFLVV